jgi:hypothetical protein
VHQIPEAPAPAGEPPMDRGGGVPPEKINTVRSSKIKTVNKASIYNEEGSHTASSMEGGLEMNAPK